MTRPLWTIGEIAAAAAGRLDLPPQKTGGPEGVPPAGCGAGPARAESAIITGVSIDTRTLAPCDLFVPLTDARDGHDFVTAAFERGATAALVRANYARQPGDGMLIRVDDPLTALGRIGMVARARLGPSARVIAVTGSAGKTGTKEMLRACLKLCAASPDRVHAPEKSFNNHWGVPLTLARMPAVTEFAVFEIGMNHAGEITPLVKMVRPHVAIVTNVLPVHVGNFPDGEIGVANAKAEIFEGLEAWSDVPMLRILPTSPPPGGEGPGVGAMSKLRASGVTPSLTPPRQGEGDPTEQVEGPSLRPGHRKDGDGKANGTAIILRDSPHYERLRAAAESRGAHVVTFGLNPESDVVLDALNSGEGEAGGQRVTAQLKAGGRNIGFRQAMIGQHLAINSLAVLAALDCLGLDPARAAPALEGVSSAAGRGARQLLGTGDHALLLLDESYNANPASMAAALANLAATDPRGRRIAVMGDMLELGADAVRYHVELKEAAGRADLVLCCGPMMRHLFDTLPPEKQGRWAPTSADLIPHVLSALRSGDAVMVKGSLGSRMAPIVDAIKKRFAGE